MIRVLLVDDHKAVLSGTKMLLENHGMHVFACHSGIDALEVLAKEEFDVFIYDLKMPEMNGIELTRRTLVIRPEAPIIIFSGEDIETNFNLIMKSGVCGIIDKSCSDTQLAISIHMALEKMVVLPLELVKKLNMEVCRMDVSDDTIEEPLTDIEIKILQFAASGKTNKEIANDLQMVQRNVEYYLSKIYKKLKVTSRIFAIRKASKLALI